MTVFAFVMATGLVVGGATCIHIGFKAAINGGFLFAAVCASVGTAAVIAGVIGISELLGVIQ